MTEIRFKCVKLHNNSKEALIKTKCTSKEIEFDIFLKESNEFYTIHGEKEEFYRKKYIKEDVDLILKALSPKEDPDVIYHYEFSNNIFTLTKVEPTDDDDTYEKIYLRVPNLKKIELSQEALEVILRQMQDFGIIWDKYNEQNQLVIGLKNNYKTLNEQYSSLVDEKDHLEEQVVEKCLELINEKKKFINNRLNEAYKNPNDSSFDMRDFVLDGGLRNSADESNHALIIDENTPLKLKKERFSPVASTSTSTDKTTPNSLKQSTPIKHKRTPSKKLFAQTQEQDSDDFDVIPLNNEKSPSPRKRKSTHDTSSIFSNIKRTPKKPKCDREEKESSVELKMDNKTESHPNYVSSSPAASDKSVENAQRLVEVEKGSLDIFKTAKNKEDSQEDLTQYTQAFDIDVDSSPILPRKSQRKAAKKTTSNQKNPYSADTIDYLNN